MRKFARFIFKVLIYSFIVGVISVGFIVCTYFIVSCNAEDKLYDSVEEIPYNYTGVVLGTSPYTKSGHTNYFFKTRMDAAADLYKSGKVKKLIVSGDNHTKYYDEPTHMRDALVSRGVPSSSIVLDYAGFRTLDSVVRAKEVFGQNKITIISQRFHNERAIYLAEHYGIDAIAFNAKDAKPTKKSIMIMFVRESGSRIKMFIDILTNKQPKFLGEKIYI